MIHRPNSVNEVANLALRCQIMLGDPTTPDIEMIGWGWQNNLSIVKHESVDVSNFSGNYDVLSVFWFADEKDAMLFKLRWGND